ncbi:MAG: N-acetylmuramoyl-L-alanine amidase family protein, partial [Acidimicrobiales bacterium]
SAPSATLRAVRCRARAAGVLVAIAALAACSAPPSVEVSRPSPVVESAGVEAAPVAAAAAPSAPADEVGAVLSPAGVAVPVLGREGSAWKVSTPCGRDAVLTSAQPIPKHPIVIDPGHGGYDPGAVGPNGLAEARLNLAVAQHARAALERAGYATVLTRNADHGMNLTNRARLATNLQARAFVSVHHNAAAWAPSGVPGSEMYHQVDSPDSKRLAGLIYEEIVAALTPYAVPWVTSGAGVTWRTRANGEDWYAMVRQPKGIAAALAELAFISNPPEARLLADPDVQRVEGEAVARGIIRFLRTDEPGSGYVDGGPMPPRPRTGGRGGEDLCDDPAL